MVIDGTTGAVGVTVLLGVDQGPQPAPLRARASKVYGVPLASPVIVQVSAAVRQVPPAGVERSS